MGKRISRNRKNQDQNIIEEAQDVDIASQAVLKVTCDTVCHSFGIWNQVMPNLKTIEQISL